MSLFVANLAFPQQASELAAAKIGILAASLMAGILGGALIAWAGDGSREES
jgi:Na+/H+ antiporter NhaA